MTADTKIDIATRTDATTVTGSSSLKAASASPSPIVELYQWDILCG